MKKNCSVEYDILISKVHRWSEIVRFGGNLVIENIKDDIKECLIMMKQDRDTLIALIFSKIERSKEGYNEIEAVNISVLSLAVGLDLGIPEDDIILLGIAALLKDLGMNKISKNILNKIDKLTEGEIVEIKNHPEYSVEIAKNLGFESNITDIILDHHERWDGKGYPSGKRANQINYMARILSVLDGYVVMKRNRPYRGAQHGYDVIKTLIEDNGRRYDSGILSVVIKSIGIYSIGSYVALNDASICRVISINRNKPLKPVLKVIVNPDGTEVQGNIVIDISENNRFFIVRTVVIN